jgi:hypothetical protein
LKRFIQWRVWGIACAGALAGSACNCGGRINPIGGADAGGPDAQTSPDAGSAGDAGWSGPDASALDGGGAGTDAGSADSDGGTDSGTGTDAGACGSPPTFRLLSPLSGSLVTARRPTLRWTASAGGSGYVVDLCRDRACAVPLGGPLAVSATQVRPPADLPPGWIFWRVHRAGAPCDVTATWQLEVGARSAPVDTSWIAPGIDFNGDGRADVLVGSPMTLQSLFVYFGTDAGVPAAPDLTVDGGYAFGTYLSNAGDLNGDGFLDIVVSSAYQQYSYANVFYGSPAGPVAGPSLPLAVGINSLVGLGDVNGDGYGDLLITSSESGPGIDGGQAFLYFGGPSGPPTAPSLTLQGTDAFTTQFGQAAAAAGDLNGDGYADFIVGAPWTGQDFGAAWVYYGGPSGPVATPLHLIPPCAGDFGISVASAGDVNGDGYADAVIGAYTACGNVIQGEAYVYLGGPGGLSTTPASSMTAGLLNYYGSDVAWAGDINGDGYADVSVANLGGNGLQNTAYLYAGSATGLHTAPLVTFQPSPTKQGVAVHLAGAGDINGDGFADFVAGAGGPPGRATVYFGTSTGLNLAAPVLLQGGGSDWSFGVSVL